MQCRWVDIGAGWARIYVGVLPSAPIGLVAATVACLIALAARTWAAPLAKHLYEGVLGRLPARLPMPRGRCL